MLSDDEWAQVARDVMDRTGLAPHGQDDDAVHWIAVRHAADHIHIVAMLARQDGRRPRLWNDFYRVGEACRAAEDRLGLRRTAPRTELPPTRRLGGNRRKPAGVMQRKLPALRSAARSAPRQQARPANLSSSPAWSKLGCWSAKGSAHAFLPRSRAMPSPCPATPPGPARRCGSAAVSSPPI